MDNLASFYVKRQVNEVETDPAARTADEFGWPSRDEQRTANDRSADRIAPDRCRYLEIEQPMLLLSNTHESAKIGTLESERSRLSWCEARDDA